MWIKVVCNYIFFLFHTVRYSGWAVSRGGLVLRHSTAHFPLNSVRWRNSTPFIISAPERRNENIIHFISSSRNRIFNLSRLQAHACTTAPRLSLVTYFILRFISNALYCKHIFCNTSFHINSIQLL